MTMLFRIKKRSIVFLQKANAARDAFDWSNAAHNYIRYLKLNPDDADVWVQLGHAHKERGDLDEAESAYLRGLSLAPQSADAHLQMGHLYRVRQELKKATIHYRLSYELDPESLHAARELAALGEQLEAANEIERELEIIDRIDSLEMVVNKLRTQSEGIIGSINDFLSKGSSVQSLAFRFLDQEKRVQARFGEIDGAVLGIQTRLSENAGLPGFQREFASDMQRLLGLISDCRAISFSVSGIKRDLAKLDARYEEAIAALRRIDELETLAKSLVTEFKTIGEKGEAAESASASWRRALEAKFDALTDSIAGQQASRNESIDERETLAKSLVTEFKAIGEKGEAAESASASWRRALEAKFDALTDSIAAQQASRNESEAALETWHSTVLAKLESSEVRNASLGKALSTLRADFSKLETVTAVSVFDATTLVGLLREPTVSDTVRALTADTAVTPEVLALRDVRIASLEERLAAVNSSLATNSAEALTKAAAAETRAMGAEAALERSNEMLTYLVNRVEFVRREMMFEFRHGPSTPDFGALETETRIIATEKFEAHRAAPQLNLGCGHITLKEYLNVDRRELPGVDIVAEADKLPYKSGEVAEIRSAHLLEHFPQEQLRRSLLPYWLDLLRPGGLLVAVVPDAAEMIAAAGRGAYGFSDFREVFFGAQYYIGDYHYNMFTPESLQALLKEAGFDNPTIVQRGRRNGACFEFEISARRNILRDRVARIEPRKEE